MKKQQSKNNSQQDANEKTGRHDAAFQRLAEEIGRILGKFLLDEITKNRNVVTRPESSQSTLPNQDKKTVERS